MDKNIIESIERKIEELEEQKEELTIELEIAKAMLNVYNALKGFTFTVGKNTKAYFDEEENTVFVVYDKSGRNFFYEEEELLTDYDPYLEYWFNPYDFLEEGCSAKDILNWYNTPEKIIEEIEIECAKWFYLLEKRAEKE